MNGSVQWHRFVFLMAIVNHLLYRCGSKQTEIFSSDKLTNNNISVYEEPVKNKNMFDAYNLLYL